MKSLHNMRRLVAVTVFIAASQAGAVTVNDDVAMAARHSQTAQKAFATLEQFARATDAAAYCGYLRELHEHNGGDALAREAVLFHATLRLVELPPGPVCHAVVAQLASREVRFYQRHDDARDILRVPLFDVAAAARFMLREYATLDQVAVASAALKAGRPLAEPDLRTAAGRRASQRALAAASDAELLAQRDTLLAAVTHDPASAASALIAARRLHDAGLLAAIVASGDEHSALAALDAALSLPDAQAARGVIESGLERAALASHSVMALGRMARDDGAITDALFDRLADAQLGGSAAAALAALADDGIAERAAAALHNEPDNLRAARLALVLRLMAGPRARGLLADYLATPGGNSELKQALGGAQ